MYKKLLWTLILAAAMLIGALLLSGQGVPRIDRPILPPGPEPHDAANPSKIASVLREGIAAHRPVLGIPAIDDELERFIESRVELFETSMRGSARTPRRSW